MPKLFAVAVRGTMHKQRVRFLGPDEDASFHLPHYVDTGLVVDCAREWVQGRVAHRPTSENVAQTYRLSGAMCVCPCTRRIRPQSNCILDHVLISFPCLFLSSALYDVRLLSTFFSPFFRRMFSFVLTWCLARPRTSDACAREKRARASPASLSTSRGPPFTV